MRSLVVVVQSSADPSLKTPNGLKAGCPDFFVYLYRGSYFRLSDYHF